MAFPPVTVHLRCSSSSAAIAVEGDGQVDLAAVGRALELDPASVRLNGYFLSRRLGNVSPGVTWQVLLAFFATHGLPTWAHPSTPVAVQGRPAPSPPRPEPAVVWSTKRKSRFERENWSKKSKLQDDSSTLLKSGDELLSDDITIGLKRRLRLDETIVHLRRLSKYYTAQSVEQKRSMQLTSLVATG